MRPGFWCPVFGSQMFLFLYHYCHVLLWLISYLEVPAHHHSLHNCRHCSVPWDRNWSPKKSVILLRSVLPRCLSTSWCSARFSNDWISEKETTNKSCFEHCFLLKDFKAKIHRVMVYPLLVAYHWKLPVEDSSKRVNLTLVNLIPRAKLGPRFESRLR